MHTERQDAGAAVRSRPTSCNPSWTPPSATCVRKIEGLPSLTAWTRCLITTTQTFFQRAWTATTPRAGSRSRSSAACQRSALFMTEGVRSTTFQPYRQIVRKPADTEEFRTTASTWDKSTIYELHGKTWRMREMLLENAVKFASYKYDATNKRNLVFEITKDAYDAITSTPCAYCRLRAGVDRHGPHGLEPRVPAGQRGAVPPHVQPHEAFALRRKVSRPRQLRRRGLDASQLERAHRPFSSSHPSFPSAWGRDLHMLSLLPRWARCARSRRGPVLPGVVQLPCGAAHRPRRAPAYGTAPSLAAAAPCSPPVRPRDIVGRRRLPRQPPSHRRAGRTSATGRTHAANTPGTRGWRKTRRAAKSAQVPPAPTADAIRRREGAF